MVSCYKDLVPFFAMVMVECSNVGLNVIFKAAKLKAMSYVFILYSYVVATLFLLPCLFIFNRNLELPPNKLSLLSRICLLGLTGFVAQVCANTGIMHSSPTLASAMSNLVPAFTFLLAIIFRIEKLSWRSTSTKAKIIGTALSITGAFVVTLCNGSNSIHQDAVKARLSNDSNWVFGGFLLAIEYLLLPVTYVIQVQILNEYPAELPVVFLYNASVMIVSCIAALLLQRNSSAWKIRMDLELAAILYSGLFGSITCTLIHTWGLRIKGPVYIATFRPMSIAIATIMSFIFLDETLHTKSLVGAIVISVGFYAVLWGKAKEESIEHFDDEGSNNRSREPLLPREFTRLIQGMSQAKMNEIALKRHVHSSGVWFLNSTIVVGSRSQEKTKQENRRRKKEEREMEVGNVSCQKDVVPFVAMVIVECTNVGLNVLYKAASLKGMSFNVFIVYSYVVATLFLLPCLFIFNRNVELPSNKFPLLRRIFLLGLTGFVAQVCANSGIMYGSPTLASAMSNLVPAFTFILAIVFRMEKVTWRSISTQAKIIGTALSIAGACAVTLYKTTTENSAMPQTSNSHLLDWANLLNLPVSNWVIGGFLLAAAYLLLSVTYIIQGQILEEYPAELHLVFYYNACVMILSFMASLLLDTDLSVWKLKLDVELAAILYSGILVSSTCTIIHTWGLRLKGPVYIALFRPLSIAIAAVMSAVFLQERLHFESFIGAVIISVGFYIVLWGKAKEEMVDEEETSCSLRYTTSKETTALLSDKGMV